MTDETSQQRNRIAVAKLKAAHAAGRAASLSFDEVTALLRLGRRETYSVVARGEISGVVRVGRSVRVSWAAAAKLLAAEGQL